MGKDHTNEVKELKESLSTLKITISQMSQAIKHLMEELTKVKMERNYLQEQNFKCEICDFQASSSSGLKSHINRKHKPEQFLSSEIVDDIQLSPTFDERDEPHEISQNESLEEKIENATFYTSSPSPSNTDINSTTLLPVQCAFHNCKSIAHNLFSQPRCPKPSTKIFSYVTSV